MARAFDELESEVRRRGSRDGYLPNLQEMFLRAAPPPHPSTRQDPSVDTFERRWRGVPYPGEQPRMIRPGYQERFLDPTKVITEQGKIPPSLSAPHAAKLPAEIEIGQGGLPPGFSFADEETQSGGGVAEILSAPGVAASMSQWSQAYDRAIKSKGAPRALALLQIATRNLKNTLGPDVDLDSFLMGSKK